MSLEELIFQHTRKIKSIRKSMFSCIFDTYHKNFMWYRLGYSSNYDSILKIWYSGWLE